MRSDEQGTNTKGKEVAVKELRDMAGNLGRKLLIIVLFWPTG